MSEKKPIGKNEIANAQTTLDKYKSGKANLEKRHNALAAKTEQLENELLCYLDYSIELSVSLNFWK